MRRSALIAGLDVGSHSIKLIVARRTREGVEVLYCARVYSQGVRKGIVIDIEGVVASIRASLDTIHKALRMKPQYVYCGVNGTHLALRSTRGVVAVALADGEITSDDVVRVINASKTISLPPNREILQTIPKEFIIDGEGGIREPIGMHGVRLEIDAFMIDGSASFMKNLRKSVEATGVRIAETVVAPIAAARAMLTKRQRELGVALVDIGAGTTNVVVYEEGDLLHVAIIPVGADSITNDIALKLKTSVDIAERIKVEHGVCLAREVARKEIIDLGAFGEEGQGRVTKKEISRIIEARTKQTIDLVAKELKKIGRHGLLPGGIVLVGGGAKMPGIGELAKDMLKLPVQIGFCQEFTGNVDMIDDPALATASGLTLFGADEEATSGVYEPGFAGKLKKFFRIFVP